MPSTSSKTYHKEKQEKKEGAGTSGPSSKKENPRKKLADRVAEPGEATGTISRGRYKFSISRGSDAKANEEQRQSERITAKEAAKDAERKK